MTSLRPRRDRGTIPLNPTRYGESALGAPLECWLPRSITRERFESDGEHCSLTLLSLPRLGDDSETPSNGRAPNDPRDPARRITAGEEPTAIVIAGLHGDEHSPTRLLSEALRTIHPFDLRAAVVLSANPDGAQRGTRANSTGVDLSRNFPAPDWSRDQLGGVEAVLSAGESPLSEPESRWLARLIERFPEIPIVDVHSFGARIFDPSEGLIGEWLARRSGFERVADQRRPIRGSLSSWAANRGREMVLYELPDAPLSELRRDHLPVLMDLIRDLR